jgi:CHAT domain-containing protein
VDGPVTYLMLPNLTTDDRQVARYLDALDRRTAEVVRDVEGSPDRDLAASAAEVAASLPELCRWAWLAAIGPLLRQYVSRRPSPAGGRVPRLILVPVADLARVPWAAACDEEGRYAVHFAAFSQVPSARLLCDIAARPPLPISPVGLVVGDPPTHGAPLKAARLEAYAIRQAYYPGARFVGRRPDGSLSPSGAGTAEQVRQWLVEPDPLAGSMLHLACHATCRTEAEGARSYLQLAAGEGQPDAGDALGARELVDLAARAGHRDLALVVLAACNTGRSVDGYDEAYSLGSGFLVGGTRSVLCTQWSIPDDETSALMFMFHHFLRHDRRPVWAAKREAQLWMLDPNREIPEQMPAQLRPTPSPVDVTAWAGFVHWGQ